MGDLPKLKKKGEWGLEGSLKRMWGLEGAL